jgi:hypothetical protein
MNDISAVACSGLVALLMIAVLFLWVCCANVQEPRHQGKAAAYTALQTHASKACNDHVLPFALLRAGTTYDDTVVKQQARLVGFPLVLKPNALTYCGKGVHVIPCESKLLSVLRTLNPIPVDLVMQAYAGPDMTTTTNDWIEARLYGSRNVTNSAWTWDPVVYARAPATVAHVVITPAAPALVTELGAVFASALPNVSAVALDVRASSLGALQRGEFWMLEINGAFGVPHTWRRDMDNNVATIFVAAGDLVRWFVSRASIGFVNVVSGRVDWVERGLKEWTWANQALALTIVNPPDTENEEDAWELV